MCTLLPFGGLVELTPFPMHRAAEYLTFSLTSERSDLCRPFNQGP